MSRLVPQFPNAAELVHRISVLPLAHLTALRPWAPLTDAEWAALLPLLPPEGPGRPLDARARLDAIFRAVTLKGPKGGRASWGQLPEAFGKADTIARSFRRWARAGGQAGGRAGGLWGRLLFAVAHPRCPPALRGLTYLACCAFRRASRLLGLAGILIARRLRLHSALPAPCCLLPDLDLSETLRPVFPALVQRMQEGGWRPDPRAIKGLRALFGFAAGRRVARWMEPA